MNFFTAGVIMITKGERGTEQQAVFHVFFVLSAVLLFMRIIISLSV